MVKKLISKSEFADLANVSAAAITKACKTILKEAVVGKRIDAAHPTAVKYLNSKRPKKETSKSPAIGIDSKYEEAVLLCKETGNYSATNLQRKLGIGWERAKSIISMIEAAGIKNKNFPKADPKEDKPKIKEKVIEYEIGMGDDGEPHQRGHASKNESKKQGRFDIGAFVVPEYIGELAELSLREIIEQYGTDVRFLDWLKATKEIENIDEKRVKNAQLRGELVSRKAVKIGIVDPIDAAHTRMLTDGAKTIARRSMALSKAGKDLTEIEEFIKDQLSSFIRPVKSKVAKAFKNV